MFRDLIVRCAAFLVVCAAMGCSTPAEPPLQQPAESQQALFSSDDPTSVEPGSGTPPLIASCPGHKLPDQCGSWQGVELAASHGGRPRPHRVEDERCLCSPIEFQIPAKLPVSSGNAGVFEAELEFRKSNGRFVECRYRGNARFGHSWKATGGDAYVLERCSDGSKAGTTLKADWFELEVNGSDPTAGITEVKLRLGAPDVVSGVVQEEIIYANDARIPGAALHVPRGSAPAGQEFTLSVLPQVPIGTTIANAGRPLNTVGYAVDVHATGVDAFAFNDVPGADCPRVELPYSDDALIAAAGPAAEGRVRARQITDLAGIATGAEVLAETGGGLRLDPVRHTASFCVQHLSFYVTGVPATGAALFSAHLAAATAACTTTADCGGGGRVCAGGACYKGCATTTDCASGETCLAPGFPYCAQDVLTTAPNPLVPGLHNKLRLVFQNLGAATWNSANPVSVVSTRPRLPAGAGTSVSPLDVSPWFSGTTGFSQPISVVSPIATNGLTTAIQIELITPTLKLANPPPALAPNYSYGSALDLCIQGAPVDVSCTTNANCSAPQTCSSGHCTCTSHSDCGRDQACTGGRCAPIYGECFSWDYPAHSTANYGAGLAPIAEISDCKDNDGNGVIDNGVPTTTVEVCGNTRDDNCNGVVNEGCVCGDGLVAGSEECDDGNTVDGDGCNHDCIGPTSCQGLSTQCQGESCCTNTVIPAWNDGGSYSVSAYRLDKYEVTVGRFSRFVAAYDDWRAAGNPALHAGVGVAANTGWGDVPLLPPDYPLPIPPWESQLPANSRALEAAVSCDLDVPGHPGQHGYRTWDSPDLALPMTCVNWYEAQAFCIWDGGRLPTEFEWWVAASNRLAERYPWGDSPDPTSTLAVFDGVPLEDVGSKPAGAGHWGQRDMVGSVWEWVFDSHDSTGIFVCHDCARTDATNPERMLEGGSARNPAVLIYSAGRDWTHSTSRIIATEPVGFRCARSP